uniref:Uncharacterized protein n=1 Tax=Cacopsylla melanoneura TaxID=428564 RepID=A0A8D8VZB9_9HEMI
MHQSVDGYSLHSHRVDDHDQSHHGGSACGQSCPHGDVHDRTCRDDRDHVHDDLCVRDHDQTRHGGGARVHLFLYVHVHAQTSHHAHVHGDIDRDVHVHVHNVPCVHVRFQSGPHVHDYVWTFLRVYVRGRIPHGVHAGDVHGLSACVHALLDHGGRARVGVYLHVYVRGPGGLRDCARVLLYPHAYAHAGDSPCAHVHEHVLHDDDVHDLHDLHDDDHETASHRDCVHDPRDLRECVCE